MEQLNSYLDYLSEKGFLEQRPPEEAGATSVFQITPKGEDLLSRVKELLQILELEESISLER